MRSAVYIGLLALAPLAFAVAADDRPPPRPALVPFSLERWKAELESESQATRLTAYSRAKADLAALRAYLRATATDDVARQTAIVPARKYALDLLKPEQESEDINVLIRNITYHYPGAVISLHPFNGFPAAIALERFGPTAGYRILGYIGTEPPENVSDKAISLYAYVMFSVFT